MWENAVGRQIRRTNRNLLLTNLALLALVLGIAFFNRRYLMSFARGPVPVSAAQVAELTDPAQLDNAFVSLDVAKVLPTGYQVVNTRHGRQVSVKADFQLAPLDHRVLIVKAKPGNVGTHFKGGFVPVPDGVLSGIRQMIPADARVVLLPFMLDTVDYGDDGWWMLSLGLPAAGLALWNLFVWTLRRDYKNHPLVEQLGDETAALQCAQQLEGELSAARKFGSASVTASWLVHETFFRASIVRLENVVWAYKKVTQHRTNFIPTGKTYEAILFDRNGDETKVSGKEEVIDGLLGAVAQSVPWVVLGFTDEIFRAWAQDRSGFFAAVDERRAKAKGTAPAAGPFRAPRTLACGGCGQTIKVTGETACYQCGTPLPA
jgi:hypothetical protein